MKWLIAFDLDGTLAESKRPWLLKSPTEGCRSSVEIAF
jgi:hydroxymethylpyrimidine pyrophosphatase-like HAD family hydrolase